MAYSDELANRVRELLYESDPDAPVDELRMMGGLCFMYRGKMLVGIVGDGLMCRVDPDAVEALLDEPGCSQMSMGGPSMPGYVLVDESTLRAPNSLRQ